MPGAKSPMEEIAHRFVDAFNARDAEGLVALCDPTIEFYPTQLVGRHGGYSGHEGLRHWMAELRAEDMGHRARVREVQTIDERRFALLSEVLIEDDVLSPSAMLGRLGDSGLLVEARAFLSDEQTLRELKLLP